MKAIIKTYIEISLIPEVRSAHGTLYLMSSDVGVVEPIIYSPALDKALPEDRTVIIFDANADDGYYTCQIAGTRYRIYNAIVERMITDDGIKAVDTHIKKPTLTDEFVIEQKVLGMVQRFITLESSNTEVIDFLRENNLILEQHPRLLILLTRMLLFYIDEERLITK